MIAHPLDLHAFRLAEMAGVLDPDDILKAMPSGLLTRWMGYYSVHVSRTDRLLAYLCAVMFNVHREKGASPKRPEDFLGIPRPKRSPSVVAKNLLMWAQVKGARTA